jgi:hypothetical protein
VSITIFEELLPVSRDFINNPSIPLIGQFHNDTFSSNPSPPFNATSQPEKSFVFLIKREHAHRHVLCSFAHPAASLPNFQSA